jgi:hypothetical protein
VFGIGDGGDSELAKERLKDKESVVLVVMNL